MRRSIAPEESRDAYLLLLPLLALLLVFIAYPVLSNFQYAFYEWKGFGKPRFVGFSNYGRMFTSPLFYVSLLNTVKLVLYIPVSLALTVLVAAFLREGFKGWGLYRAILYLPNLLGPVIMGVVLAVTLRNSGPLNTLLRGIGLGFLALDWLGSAELSIHAVGVLQVVWVRLGFGLIYFLSAMSAIEPSLYEAAIMDGASWWKRFLHVTIPSIIFSIEFWTVLCFIEVFARMFGFIFSFTRGGPGYSTFTLEYGIYDLAFTNLKMGMASAWATVLFAFCALIAVAQLALVKEHGI